ncbi:hypothetical protein GKZ28_27495 [Clostridium chromiireducens]|uniref:Uncharacterized protein n=1 Tax=Clostridium chromiireducens TaxID=225345 RepID=A0A964RT57_9CLOT|nr:hypothetical protein [Clostridium chromiireducens]MVX67369.1 hypothetical protein [Clostridium chromiireducens]
MDEREELKHELEQELRWVQYRIMILDLIDEKLLQMKLLAEKAKNDNLTKEELKALNTRINDLAMQVKALDGESRRIEDNKIL